MLLFGCESMQITKERQTIQQLTEAVFLKVIDAAEIDQSNLSADGSVKNPEYRFSFVAGMGPYASGSIQAIGVELGGRIAAGSSGPKAETDQDMREKLFTILQRSEIADEERAKIWNEFLEKVGDRIATPTSQPVE